VGSTGPPRKSIQNYPVKKNPVKKNLATEKILREQRAQTLAVEARDDLGARHDQRAFN